MNLKNNKRKKLRRTVYQDKDSLLWPVIRPRQKQVIICWDRLRKMEESNGLSPDVSKINEQSIFDTTLSSMLMNNAPGPKGCYWTDNYRNLCPTRSTFRYKKILDVGTDLNTWGQFICLVNKKWI